jgi:hypothetical protein
MVNPSARVVAAVIAALLVALPGSAATNGLKVGDGKLPLAFELETRFDSTAGFGISSGLRPDFIVKARPSAKLEVPSPALAVNALALFEWNQYVGLAGIGGLSYPGGQAELGLTFARDAPFTVEIADRFMRSDRTSLVAAKAAMISNFNAARLKLMFRPGKGSGGGALEIGGWFENQLELMQKRVDAAAFEGGCSGDPLCDPALVEANSYMNNQGGLEGRLRFLPRTAFIADVSFGNRFYFNTGFGNTPAWPLRAQVGLAGLVTTKVSTVLKVGWGHSLIFNSTGLAPNNFNSVIGQLEIAYAFSETFNARAGFVRNFSPTSGSAAFNEEDRIYMDGGVLFGNLSLYLAGNFSLIPFGTATTGTRQDLLFDLSGGVDWEIVPWAHAGMGVLWQIRGSSDAAAGYNRFEGFLRASVQY